MLSFTKCSYELAGIITYFFVCNGVVPENRKRSIVTPVPGVPKRTCFSHLRPTSVTSILSRLDEKLIIKNWLFPAINPANISDQFAFKHSGSTTCALTFFVHRVMLPDS